MALYKRLFLNFKYNETDAFADYLHDMSLQGWHFKSWGVGLMFEKGEPANVVYAVEVFPKGSEMDLKPEETTEEYARYCSAAGWQLLDAKKKFCIFKRVDDEAIDIVTPEERFANIRKAMWNHWLNESLVRIIIAAFYLWLFLGQRFADYIFMDIMLVVMAVFALSILGGFVSGLKCFIWSIHTKKLLKSGEEIHYISHINKSGIWKEIILIVFTVLLTMMGLRSFISTDILIVPIIVFIITGTGLLLTLFRPSRSTNYLIQTGVSIFCVLIFTIWSAVVIFDGSKLYEVINSADIDRSNVPLLLEDIMDKGEIDEQIVYIDEGFFEGIFGKRLHCKVEYAMINNAERSESIVNDQMADALSADVTDIGAVSKILLYDVYYTENAWILDRIWQSEVMKEAVHPVDCTKEWSAVIAVKDLFTKYYVRYDNGIMILYASDELNMQQIEIICEKMGFAR